jgi:hypothetical protein
VLAPQSIGQAIGDLDIGTVIEQDRVERRSTWRSARRRLAATISATRKEGAIAGNQS